MKFLPISILGYDRVTVWNNVGGWSQSGYYSIRTAVLYGLITLYYHDLHQEYIVAGSDEKLIFFWDRISGETLKVYKGDNTLVNCVQPHPYLPLIASSG